MLFQFRYGAQDVKYQGGELQRRHPLDSIDFARIDRYLAMLDKVAKKMISLFQNSHLAKLIRNPK